MKRLPILLLVFIASLAAVSVAAAEVPIPPAPTRWATDTAGFMSPQALAAVDQRLEQFERATGNQVLVWIGSTTGDTPTEEWTVNAFAKWKVGRKGLDNGLILFLFAKDQKVRVEVGYGLEDKVPDIIASRIIRDVIVPRIQAGDRDGAVSAGVDALMNAIQPGSAAGDEAAPPAVPRHSAPRPISIPQMILMGILGLAFLVLLITHPGLAIYLLFSLLSGGRGGGGGGGGGFSGGGGSSGGGGATGSW